MSKLQQNTKRIGGRGGGTNVIPIESDFGRAYTVVNSPREPNSGANPAMKSKSKII
jgi:hypothetical protein